MIVIFGTENDVSESNGFNIQSLWKTPELNISIDSGVRTCHEFFVFYFFLRNADKRTIMKAYRKLAVKWHPDKYEKEEDKKNAQKHFIDIAAAKEVLTDPGEWNLL